MTVDFSDSTTPIFMVMIKYAVYGDSTERTQALILPVSGKRVSDNVKGNVIDNVSKTDKTIGGIDYDFVEVTTKGIMGQVTNSLGTFGAFTYQFVFESGRLAPAGNFDLKNMIFLAPNPNVSFSMSVATSSSTISDINDLNGNDNTTEKFASLYAAVKFNVTKKEELQVYGEAKLDSSPESGVLVYDPTNASTQEATTLV